jgi:hypothetical protein
MKVQSVAGGGVAHEIRIQGNALLRRACQETDFEHDSRDPNCDGKLRPGRSSSGPC